jgi:large subunit ribosomal protein L7/L12
MSETAIADDIRQLGDKIVTLTLKQAKELSDYLKDVHGIEAAAGGAVMMAAPSADAAPAKAAEQTEFDVVLAAAGDKKLEVVKVVKNITGASLMDAKKMVESAPVTIKQAVAKADAEKLKAQLAEAGATVELK